MLESIKKFFKALFSGMGLIAMLIGGVTVVIGNCFGKRCVPGYEEPTRPE